MFNDIKIEKSGKELKDACQARINKAELPNFSLSSSQTATLDIIARNLIDSYKYELTIEEARFLNI